MDITQRQQTLPATIEELHEFILIGRERLQAHKAKLRAIDRIPRAHAAKEAALKDAQDVAGIVIDAQAKLGEMLADLSPKVSDEKRDAIEDYHWMIEEYKVSLFAQELKTAIPISEKRLDKKAGEIERML